jgi:hypothetical protein
MTPKHDNILFACFFYFWFFAEALAGERGALTMTFLYLQHTDFTMLKISTSDFLRGHHV